MGGGALAGNRHSGSPGGQRCARSGTSAPTQPFRETTSPVLSQRTPVGASHSVESQEIETSRGRTGATAPSTITTGAHS